MSLSAIELPALADGHVTHRRYGPVPHRFRHAAYLWLVDLDDLPQLPRPLRPFAGFRSADHLGDPALSIKANVVDFVARSGVLLGEGCRIVMLANARVLGHVFDPITVFWCFDEAARLVCVVAEVHNTYGERHAYLLRPDHGGAANASKQLYVSPFFDVSGSYRLRFVLRPDRVASVVTLHRSEGGLAFSAAFTGRLRRASTAAVVRQLIRQPLMPQRVSTLIRLHGFWLWARRLPVAPRPAHNPQEGV